MSRGTLRLIDARTNGVVEFKDVDDYHVTPTGKIVIFRNQQPITLLGEYKLPHPVQVRHTVKPVHRADAHLGATE